VVRQLHLPRGSAHLCILVKALSSSDFEPVYFISWSNLHETCVVEVKLRQKLNTPFTSKLGGRELESRSSDNRYSVLPA
jgi:hypothetical protein